ncbi:MAG: PASTA domain-containing protein [Planctomycetota bacterium]|nr:PASTA domain-containing protein [Planctomycetota bacterium]
MSDGDGSAVAAAGDEGDGLEVVARGREGALERLKKALAAREAPMPTLEGYPLRKAQKILALAGIDPSRVRLRVSEHPQERGAVVRQRPRAGAKVDLEDEGQKVELTVADRSIVGYLPQIFQRSDLSGRSFVRDFLWIVQHLQFQIDEKLENLDHYFDAHECPEEFLAYLASWVALTLEPGWPEAKRRSLIKKAVELYHLRGTPRGLRVYLRIFTGVDPVIIENAWPFEGFVVGVSSTVGVDTVLTHLVNRAHTFIVHVPLPIDDVDLETIRRIHRIIEQEKPVHTDYYLTFAEPTDDGDDADTGITVGVTSTIGVDTWIKGDPDDEAFDPLGGEGSMAPADED